MCSVIWKDLGYWWNNSQLFQVVPESQNDYMYEVQWWLLWVQKSLLKQGPQFGIWYWPMYTLHVPVWLSLTPPALCDLQTAGHIFIICQSSDRKPSWCMCNEPGHTKLHLCLTKMPSSRAARCPLRAIVLLRISSPAAWAFGLYGHSWWPGVKAIVTDSPSNPPNHNKALFIWL